jgi:hypothetical protein
MAKTETKKGQQSVRVAPAKGANPQARPQPIEDARPSARADVQARKHAEREAARRRQAAQRMMLTVGGLVAVAAIAVGLFFWYGYTHPGESFPDQGNNHIQALTDAHDPYNSDPPTSGPHMPGLAAWGFYDKPQANEELVHNLEDGGVILWYREDIAPADLDQLKAMVKSYDSNFVTRQLPTGDGGRVAQHVVLTPYPPLKGTSNLVVATAWTRMQRFQTLDLDGMRHFIDMYRAIDHHKGSE